MPKTLEKQAPKVIRNMVLLRLKCNHENYRTVDLRDGARNIRHHIVASSR